MKARVQKWGNSLGLRLPKSLASAAHLEQNDEVDLVPTKDGFRIIKIEKESETLDDLLAASPEGSFELSDEDKAWLNAEPVGKERID